MSYLYFCDISAKTGIYATERKTLKWKSNAILMFLTFVLIHSRTQIQDIGEHNFRYKSMEEQDNSYRNSPIGVDGRLHP